MEKLMYAVWKPDATPSRNSGTRSSATRPRRSSASACAGSPSIWPTTSPFRGCASRGSTRRDGRACGSTRRWIAAPIERALARVDGAARGLARPRVRAAREHAPRRAARRAHARPLHRRVPREARRARLRRLAGALAGRPHAVAIETQSTFAYVQNVLVRPVTPDAPPWTAIVEEAFPAEAADRPHGLLPRDDAREQLAENQRRMMESCERSSTSRGSRRIPMSAYVLR